jgi:hypothetical protein
LVSAIDLLDIPPERFATAGDRLHEVVIAKTGFSDFRAVDYVHEDFLCAPMEVIMRIYDTFGLNLDAETEAKMRQRVADAPELSHGALTHQATDFGMSEDEILERFGDYPERFGLHPTQKTEAAA